MKRSRALMLGVTLAVAGVVWSVAPADEAVADDTTNDLMRLTVVGVCEEGEAGRHFRLENVSPWVLESVEVSSVPDRFEITALAGIYQVGEVREHFVPVTDLDYDQWWLFVGGGYQFTATERAGDCSALQVHLHDLKPTPYDIDGDKWVARVLIKVRDSNGAGLGDVNVTAVLGGKTRTCTTNQFGKCKVKIKTVDTRPKLPVEIIDVDWIGGYDSSANRDVDRDGDSERVLIWRPF